MPRPPSWGTMVGVTHWFEICCAFHPAKCWLDFRGRRGRHLSPTDSREAARNQDEKRNKSSEMQGVHSVNIKRETGPLLKIYLVKLGLSKLQ
jgi:hypothetical protein